MFDMETCISSKVLLQKHSSQQRQRVWSHVFKCWNPCPNRSLVHGKGVVHLYLNWKGLQDVAIWNILKSFPALQSWQKDFLHVPFISIHLIQMLARRSLQAHLILMFQARVLFFSAAFFSLLYLTAKTSVQTADPSPFHRSQIDPVQLQSSWL